MRRKICHELHSEHVKKCSTTKVIQKEVFVLEQLTDIANHTHGWKLRLFNEHLSVILFAFAFLDTAVARFLETETQAYAIVRYI